MPFAKLPPTKPTVVSPPAVRRSGRRIRSTVPFDQSTDASVAHTPVARKSPVQPVHDLVLDPPEETVESDLEEATEVEPHISSSFTKKQLHQKWLVSSNRIATLKMAIIDLKREVKDLKTRVMTAERAVRIDECGKSKAEKLQYDLTVASVEKNALEEELVFLKSEQARANISHKNQLKSVETDRRVKIETQKLTSQRLLQEEKLKGKEGELIIRALEEKITRLEEVISSQATKVKEYDAITAQAVKANISLYANREKANVR